MQAEGNNTVPQLPCLCILKVPNTFTLSTGWRENQGASLLFPSQEARWGTPEGELCVSHQGMVPHTLGQSHKPPTPCCQALTSWALENISWAPWDDLAPKFSSSSPSPSHSPAMRLQAAHGDTAKIHPEATSNRGGKKRTCTIQEASTAAHREQDINTDCSSEDLEIKKKKPTEQKS